MPQVSVEYLAAVEYLKDGHWHDADKTLRRVMDAVPPGKAAQMAERQRLQQFRKVSRASGPRFDSPPRSKSLDMDAMVKTGARTIARQLLNNRKRFEYNEDRTMIRLVPEEVRRELRHITYVRRGSKAWETRLRSRGIDPATHKSKAQLAAERRAEMQAWTPEQWAEYHSENSRKSWIAKREKEAHAATKDLSGRGGPEQQDHPRPDAGVRPGSPHQRQGGNHPGAEEVRGEGRP